MPELNRCGGDLISPQPIPRSQNRCYRLEVQQPDEPLPRLLLAPAAVDAGFKPVEAADAYEAEQIVQREHLGAVTAYLSERVTNEEEIRRLFLAWLEKV